MVTLLLSAKEGAERTVSIITTEDLQCPGVSENPRQAGAAVLMRWSRTTTGATSGSRKPLTSASPSTKRPLHSSHGQRAKGTSEDAAALCGRGRDPVCTALPHLEEHPGSAVCFLFFGVLRAWRSPSSTTASSIAGLMYRLSSTSSKAPWPQWCSSSNLHAGKKYLPYADALMTRCASWWCDQDHEDPEGEDDRVRTNGLTRSTGTSAQRPSCAADSPDGAR